MVKWPLGFGSIFILFLLFLAYITVTFILFVETNILQAIFKLTVLRQGSIIHGTVSMKDIPE
jgi:hypothetical protein